jgi:hypothetical protein
MGTTSTGIAGDQEPSAEKWLFDFGDWMIPAHRKE